jgi:Flp pilus assembly protein TadD
MKRDRAVRPAAAAPFKEPRRRIPAWASVALVLGLVLAAYWPCLHGGLLWDDEAHVTRADLQPLSGLLRIWTDLSATQQYYPVLHTAFWIEHRLWGDATLGYHLVNVLLHGVDACLFAGVLAALGRRVAPGAILPPGAAWLAALLFAVHPVCVESVAWISEQKNTLSLAFYLLSAWAYLGFSGARGRGSYILAFLLFCAALGTKSVTATLPAALLLVTWWTAGRLAWRRDVVPLLPWFAIAAASGLLTAWVERHVIGAEGPAYDLSLPRRFLLAGHVIWFYLGKLAWPEGLTFIYPRWEMSREGVLDAGCLAAAVLTTVLLWIRRGRSRGPLASWLFFVGSLLPVLGFFNIFPFLYSYVADHFQYLPSLGIFALAGGGIALLLARLPAAMQGWGGSACALLVAFLALLTRVQSGDYRDSETLYLATIARNPSCWMAEDNLAVALDKAGRSADALAHVRRALEIRPDYPEARNNLGVQLAGLPGHEQEAIAQFREALREKPGFGEAHVDLANLLVRLPGREAEAEYHYRVALRLEPDSPEAFYDLAGFLARQPGRDADAIAVFRQSLRLRPNSAEAHSNLAVVLARTPEGLGAAYAEFSQALLLDPNFEPAHINMAILCYRQGLMEMALSHCEAALRISPGDGQARRLLEQLHRVPGR